MRFVCMCVHIHPVGSCLVFLTVAGRLEVSMLVDLAHLNSCVKEKQVRDSIAGEDSDFTFPSLILQICNKSCTIFNRPS